MEITVLFLELHKWEQDIILYYIISVYHSNRRKIRLIEGNAKFLRLKSDQTKGLCGSWLSV
jgi:hypothetical protein